MLTAPAAACDKISGKSYTAILTGLVPETSHFNRNLLTCTTCTDALACKFCLTSWTVVCTKAAALVPQQFAPPCDSRHSDISCPCAAFIKRAPVSDLMMTQEFAGNTDSMWKSFQYARLYDVRWMSIENCKPHVTG